MAASKSTNLASAESHGRVEQFCAHCNKPASDYCRGCSEAIDERNIPLKTFYCNTECQKAGWPAHKIPCNDLRRQKLLHRAAYLLQAAFYNYRTRMFDISIAKIERKGQKLHVWEGPYGEMQCLATFPTHLITNEKDKEALLSHLTCNDTLAWMYELERQLLDGICSQIQEACVALKNKCCEIVFYQGHNIGLVDADTDHGHCLLKVCLRGGDTYALDISSAQYGYHNPISSWKDYARERVTEVESMTPFGTWRQRTDIHKVRSIQAAIAWHHQKATAAMNQAVALWLVTNKITLKDLLCLREDAFLMKRSELLAAIDDSLVRFLDYVANGVKVEAIKKSEE